MFGVFLFLFLSGTVLFLFRVADWWTNETPFHEAKYIEGEEEKYFGDVDGYDYAITQHGGLVRTISINLKDDAFTLCAQLRDKEGKVYHLSCGYEGKFEKMNLTVSDLSTFNQTDLINNLISVFTKAKRGYFKTDAEVNIITPLSPTSTQPDKIRETLTVGRSYDKIDIVNNVFELEI